MDNNNVSKDMKSQILELIVLNKLKIMKSKGEIE